MTPRGNRDAAIIAAMLLVVVVVAALGLVAGGALLSTERACGRAPLSPGYTLTGEGNGTILISSADWTKIAEYHYRVRVWSACVEGGLGVNLR